MTQEQTKQSTPQEQIKDLLQRTGLPAKEISVYGSQIVVTVWSHDAARKWARLIQRFATLRGITESMDYNKVNKNTCLLPSVHKVWRVFGVIA